MRLVFGKKVAATSWVLGRRSVVLLFELAETVVTVHINRQNFRIDLS